MINLKSPFLQRYTSINNVQLIKMNISAHPLGNQKFDSLENKFK